MLKLTDKQERFCQVYHSTGNKSEAYRQAYNCENMKEASINRKAVEVAENVNVAARLDKMRKEAMERTNVTVDGIAEMYQEAFEVARENMQASAMATAATGMAKLYGLDALTKIQIDKISNESANGTEDKMVELLSEISEKLPN